YGSQYRADGPVLAQRHDALRHLEDGDTGCAADDARVLSTSRLRAGPLAAVRHAAAAARMGGRDARCDRARIRRPHGRHRGVPSAVDRAGIEIEPAQDALAHVTGDDEERNL